MSKTEMPSIRFYGFDNDWEQRKFDEAFIERRNKTEKENEDILLSCAINGMFLNSELFGHFRGTTTIGYLRVKKNDLILSAQNLHLGNANVNLRFEHGIISPAYKVYDLNNCNPEFVQSWVKRDDTKKFFLAATTEGASQCRKNIEWETLGKQTISMPSLDEQKRIGSFFSQLDNLITLHQRKFEKLTNVKKSMLEKMFPRNGSCYPEIRFKGFTDPWEQRKFGELVDRVVRKNTNNESTLPLTISAQYGLVDQITYFNNRVASRNVSNYYLVLNGEFAYNKSTSDGYPFGAVKRLDLYEKGVLSTLYIVFAPKKEQQIDSDYLTVFFDTDRWHKGVAERAAEGARNHGLLNISAEDFFDIDLSVPKDIVEQRQIGAFIRQFDNLITLHQRELEKLQSIKKALLDKMFV